MKRSIFSLLMIGFLFLCGLFLASTVLNPKVTADVTSVDAANQLYLSGHYAEAVQLYEGQVERGVQDSVLFFNLGNAYFQQGDMGRAVLNLERAAQLNPRDNDIKTNLALVREQTTELFSEEPSGPVAILADVTGWMTENETAVLLLSFWFLLSFLILARRQVESETAKRALQVGAILVLALLLISGTSLASRSFLQQTQPAGVVVSPTVAVSNGPGAEFATDFQLNGGTSVNFTETQGKWVRLALPEGAGESWLPVEAIEPVAELPQAMS